MTELDLIDEEHPGRPVLPDDMGAVEVGAWGIEVTEPEPRLYSFDGIGADTIVATRMRDDGRYEHAVIDEYGMPTEWRLADYPDLN